MSLSKCPPDCGITTSQGEGHSPSCRVENPDYQLKFKVDAFCFPSAVESYPNTGETMDVTSTYGCTY